MRLLKDDTWYGNLGDWGTPSAQECITPSLENTTTLAPLANPTTLAPLANFLGMIFFSSLNFFFLWNRYRHCMA